MRNLQTLRKDIDTLDEQIIDLIAKRFDVVREVGKYKAENNIEAHDPTRWQAVLHQIKARAKDKDIPEAFIETMYETMHDQAIEIEKQQK